MPSLFRFLFITGSLAGAVFGSMYVLATAYEPESHEVSESIGNVKIKQPDAPQ